MDGCPQANCGKMLIWLRFGVMLECVGGVIAPSKKIRAPEFLLTRAGFKPAASV
jgi:hypothetical protein